MGKTQWGQVRKEVTGAEALWGSFLKFIYLAALDLSCNTWDLCCRIFHLGDWAELILGMGDLSSLTRDQIRVPCFARRILNHWTTWEIP